MGSVVVDQVASDGSLLQDVDARLTTLQKNDLLLAALPGATVETYAGVQVVRFRDQVILRKQVTYLGIPWEGFKKRIQIPNTWLEAHHRARAEGLKPRFVGIYRYLDVTVFVDFDPSTYVQRKANNSAAHVATNDLHQAQTLGVFSREDKNGNRLTSVRFEEFAGYLLGTVHELHPRLDVFSRFNDEFLSNRRIEALDAIQEMHRAVWPDRFQGEWPGFYLEYRLNEFVRRSRLEDLVEFQRVKTAGSFDYDLVFKDVGQIDYYGDLKSSNIAVQESPGNDAEDIRRCIAEFGRFWYVIYEHDTWHGRSEGDLPTIAWNEWRRSVGFDNGNDYNPLSYRGRFKAAVRYSRMKILEVNEANFHIVLGDFNQGQQQGGGAREPKVKITKKNIDNFLIFSGGLDLGAGGGPNPLLE